MNKLLLAAMLAQGSLAALSGPKLLGRQLEEIPCSESGEKDCGDGCIPLSYTCCPDGAGGCPSTDYCNLGSNGEYNCCPRGGNCGGPGGATTFPGGTVTSVSYSTSTIVEEPTTPSASPTTEIPTASLPILTLTSTTPLPPTTVPNGTATASVPVVTGGAAANGYSAANVLGWLAGAAAFLF